MSKVERCKADLRREACYQLERSTKLPQVRTTGVLWAERIWHGARTREGVD